MNVPAVTLALDLSSIVTLDDASESEMQLPWHRATVYIVEEPDEDYEPRVFVVLLRGESGSTAHLSLKP